MKDRYEETIGLSGSGTVDVKIYLPTPFETTPAERELIYTIVDAVEKFRSQVSRTGKQANG